MQPNFQTSFIPKKPVGGDVEKVSVVHDTDIFSLAATIVFIVTLLLYGGLYFYKSLIVKQIAEANKQLEDARSAILPEKIKELLDANSRINTASDLLERHLVNSKMLLLLNDLAIKKLKFNDLSYSNKTGSPTLKINGEVSSYNALARQQQIFTESEYVKNPTFSNIGLDSTGNIKFQFTSTIDSGLLSYKKSIETLSVNQ
jgi:archaellum component FlaF (FlaF/FlaG flagellin family)